METHQIPKVPGGEFRYQRRYTKLGVHPYDAAKWETRDAVITDAKGQIIFEQKGVEAPSSWSETATNIVASKYFRGRLGTRERESSVRQLLDRVAKTITKWGVKGQYFLDEEEAQIFEAELTHILLNQMAAFNSPVWFNVGVEDRPQCSACFINSVRDDMRSIMQLAMTEGMLFKYGSGTGSNLSALRSSKEHLSTGGKASGPVSFMKGYDAFAGVIKSGGRTRRAAKMVILNADHPDVVEFIWSKANEEKKAWALIDAGYDGAVDGEAYGSVFFQNANNSVRVNDEFMRAVETDADWSMLNVKDGKPSRTVKARHLWQTIAEQAHFCGDPGLQFDTTINDWHTCPNTGRINASNPCSEYMHLDDSACNLASLNLMRFVEPDGSFDVAAFRHAVDIVIAAQDIVVDRSSYPTPEIAATAHAYRELGLGYANLGALLMSLGLPYDSDAGREYAAAVTALMCGEAHRHSAAVAAVLGPYEGYARNREPQLGVIEKHRAHAYKLDPALVPLDLLAAAREAWDGAREAARAAGVRNSQLTVLAPTGTIAFMMDCDTTGVEPDIALVKYKKLVGGGVLKLVNHTVPRALRRVGYEAREIQEIVEYIDEQETIEGAPGLRPEHLPVFDCAFRPARGARSIHPLGHLRMMGAVQPFISGAISKTINVPESATPEEIANAYIESWRLGLKAVAVYRDGCKRSQPLSTSKDQTRVKVEAAPGVGVTVEGQPRAVRRRLPDERRAITHKFSIAGHDGYVTVGMYEDGQLGEIFLVMAKEGSVVSGLMDCFATAVSMALQYGVPLQVLVDKFSHVRFEPSGFTNNPEIPIAKSIVDYIFRWLASKFLAKDQQQAIGVHVKEDGTTTATDPGARAIGPVPISLAPGPTATSRVVTTGPATTTPGPRGTTPGSPGPGSVGAAGSDPSRSMFAFRPDEDAPPCPDCGSIMVRNGACYKCLNCGATSGCS